MRRHLSVAPLAAVLTLAACELQEITFAPTRDVVIAEVILQAGARVQTAYLHRTSTLERDARVFGARVIIFDEERGTELELIAAADSLCLTPAPPGPLPSIGSCHAAVVGESNAIRPGATYSLRVELPDREPLVARTTVPGDFRITTPTLSGCRLAPATELTLEWTASEGAWVYLTQARFRGLAAALRGSGVEVPAVVPDPLNLVGLAIGAADTTMAFPGGFGVFDRADEALAPVLLAIRDGLPPGVTAEVAVASADRNYVNWVRGGNFNPSGTVRVPSVSGGGSGVFGSLVVRRVTMQTTGLLPPCSGG